MYRLFFLVITFMSLFLTGCVATLQTNFAWSDKLYQGPFKEQDQIAILVQNEKQRVHLEKINSNAFKKSLGVVYELLPGEYQLCIGLLYLKGNYKHYSKKCQNVEFLAKAGHIYEFDAVENNYQKNWHPVIRDITEDLKDPDREKEAKKIEAMMQNARDR